MPLDIASLFDQIPDAVYLLDPETSNVIECNRAGYQMLGMDKKEILNHSVLSLQKDVKGLPHWTEISAVIQANKDYTFTGRHRHKDGSEISVEVYTRYFVENNTPYFLSVARNISKRLAFEQTTQDHNQRLWHTLNQSLDGMWDWNLTNDHVFFSLQLKTMLGYGPDEMEPHVDTWKDNIHPEDMPLVLQRMQDHLADRRERYQAEYRLKNRNGHFIWVQDRGRICERDDKGNPSRVVGIVQDITDLKQIQLTLEAQASEDILTGLANRRKAEQVLSEQLRLIAKTQQTLSIGLIDLDHFKQINDLHGHHKGDKTLKQAGLLLQQNIGSQNFIARWGGEEFILIMPSTNQQQAISLSDQLHQAFAKFNWNNILGIQAISFSMGLTNLNSSDNLDINTLLIEIDQALYKAKHQGRNQTVNARENSSNH
ncbi:diguanylate cyclase [Thiomicrospira microaerophila]|uniref:sensor domain-containing diguanylate cyclase n=1 Tax=Thiomicrospira microaerophila TaxID=406020 RepID=UPI00200D836C|nr:diguanylate cyclase [Thiomicrospira microaerophila]UQB43094.1 diguanylate cyclase [Thiomicrospira microaerophila]